MAPSRKYRGIISGRIRQQAGDSGDDNDWLAIYGDLMSLLLVFFVLFYIFSVTGQLPLLSEALQAYQSEETMRAENIPETQQTLTPSPDNSEITISIPSEILFDLGQADLKPKAMSFLAEAVDSIKSILVDDPDAQIRIEGYTDDIPIHNWRFRNNWELSAARAIAVVRYFIEDEQFDPSKLQAMGYGEYNPVVPNDTPLNRQKNRRVEIKVVKPPSRSDETQVPPNSADETRKKREKAAQDAATKLLKGEGK
ncbi:OmpA family protein [bacterium]|nr:OmpA family protein [bacterium]